MSIEADFSLRYNDASAAALEVNLCLPGRGITAVFGASGAGKTSFLRCLAGLERPQGRLRVLGELWQDEQHFLPVHRRPLGYVFQDPGLFPHLDVAGNLRYAKRRAWSTSSADDVVELMGLAPLLDRLPQQLSGGERQRVAIARALLVRPRLLLMDEPLAALDAARKREILPYLERLHAHQSMPVIYVSHSLDEVARLADQIVVLEQGRVKAQGAAVQILPGLAETGADEQGVLVEARVVERDTDWHLLRLEFAGGSLWVPDNGKTLDASVRLHIFARDVSLSRDEQPRSSILNRLAARIEAIEDEPDGPQALVRLRVGETLVLARLTRRSVNELQLGCGQGVWAQIKSVALVR